MQIDGNIALVTGAGSGLGEATARHLHAGGAQVVLFDLDEARVTAVAASLGARALAVPGDATDDGDTQRAVDAAAELGDLRIVVACAGGGTVASRLVGRDGSPHDMALFRHTMDLNVTTTFNTLRLAAAQMSKQDGVGDDGERGAIVLTSSLAGYEGQIGTIAYSTAKAAIIGMTLVAARDLAAAAVRVNCIAPGTMNTVAWEKASPEVKASLEAKVPFPRRFGEPHEFAALAEHLVTNTYLNGHVVRLDGAIRFDPK
jgi:NAD(P)-dependent dehydrogenase (short-subunit alcohol dehydrogenase family)